MAVVLPSGKALVLGGVVGYSENGMALSTNAVELYDPATGIWTTASSMTQARRAHSAVLLPDGKVLTAGGFNGLSYGAQAEIYDPAADSWAPTGGMTWRRADYAAATLADGKILVSGGKACAADCSYPADEETAEIYDPVAATWAATGSMHAPRRNHTATPLPDGKILVAGGRNEEGELYESVNSAEVYDPATGAWTTTGSLQSTRAFHSAILLADGKVLAAGGAKCTITNPSGTKDITVCNGLSTAELYDPATGTWSSTGSMSTARRGASFTLLCSGRVLAAGGYYSTSLATAELYDPAAGTWTLTSSMATARSGPAAVRLLSGSVLIAGGSSSNSQALLSAELYY